MKVQSSKVTKRRLFPETLELIRQCGNARAAGNRELTSELAKHCREAISEDLRERRAAVMAEAAEAGEGIRKGTVIAFRKVMEKIIRECYSDLFDSHVHLWSYEIK
ncbi:unnamed protein product [Angiostrongylus costaricensis]|uniref:DUF4145 domain-containing protein n=1 Tax=Angiostrongylus costaricensis TaxID=334426 RepID=A0A0R3PGV2_ANGCS|nr:unnamed protein product [Angiostrongylus costaricensis]